MVRSVGVRELKEHTSQVLRLVREHHQEIEITHRGRAIARLIPVVSASSHQDPEAIWADLDDLAAEIGARWPARISAVEAVREQRREL